MKKPSRHGPLLPDTLLAIVVGHSDSVRQLVVTMASEWNDELVLTFIDEFKNYRCLWDPKDTDRKSKNKKMMLSGAGRKDVFKPSWFAIDAIHTFMQDVYTPHETKDTV
ncbi:MADF domain-containing protein [Aphis craccivora]|uniref:MADF domain-containing protein n=1 Tax=Aphis craccivora TaxID=307492 RepID=A0A6G0Y6E4_APHCR|nr:MADF domain-containing protein [Aphis craccivora]